MKSLVMRTLEGPHLPGPFPPRKRRRGVLQRGLPCGRDPCPKRHIPTALELETLKTRSFQGSGSGCGSELESIPAAQPQEGASAPPVVVCPSLSGTDSACLRFLQPSQEQRKEARREDFEPQVSCARTGLTLLSCALEFLQGLPRAVPLSFGSRCAPGARLYQRRQETWPVRHLKTQGGARPR